MAHIWYESKQVIAEWIEGGYGSFPINGILRMKLVVLAIPIATGF